MKHSDFLLMMACLITLCFIVVVMTIFLGILALTDNVWLSLAILAPVTILLLFITAKLTDRK